MADRLDDEWRYWWDTDNGAYWFAYNSNKPQQSIGVAALDFDWDPTKCAFSNILNDLSASFAPKTTEISSFTKICSNSIQVSQGTGFTAKVETAEGWIDQASSAAAVRTVIASRIANQYPAYSSWAGMFGAFYITLDEIGDGLFIPQKWSAGGQANSVYYWHIFNPDGQPTDSSVTSTWGSEISTTWAGLQKGQLNHMVFAQPYAEIGDRYSKKYFWDQRDRWYFISTDGTTWVGPAGTRLTTLCFNNPLTVIATVTKLYAQTTDKEMGPLDDYCNLTTDDWFIHDDSLVCAGYPNLFGQTEAGEGVITDIAEVDSYFTDIPKMKKYQVYWDFHLGETWCSQYLYNEFGLMSRPQDGFPLCTAAAGGKITFKVHTGTDAGDACYFAVRKNDPFTRKKDGLDNSNVWNTDAENQPIILNSDTEKEVTFDVDLGDKIWIKCWPQNAGTRSKLYWDGGSLIKDN